MSQENVEIVRRLNEAFGARDIETFVAGHHPNAEAVNLRSQIMGPYRGHDGLRRMVAETFETAPDFEIRIDEIRDCGNRVLVLGRQRGTVRGAPFDQLLAEQDVARRHLCEAGHHAEGRRLAGPAGAEEGHEFASLDFQAHVVHGRWIAAVPLGDVAQ